MARVEYPLNPSVLQWARVRAGYSVSALTTAYRDYERWEAGEGGPTYPQLEGLAEKLKIPVAVFFFPGPPETPEIEETFRTLPDTEMEQLAPRMRLLLRKAKAFQLNVAELCDNRNPAQRLITDDISLSTSRNIATMAREVRGYLGVTIEDQIGWNNDEDALKKWRDCVQGVGVFVFKDAFDAPGFSGFCLNDEIFPIIYVNNTNAKTRQIFTIFHELAHLLFDTSGIDSDNELSTRSNRADQIEITCNAFAAEFLLPDTVFEAARGRLPATEQTAVALAQQFHISRESVFRRFLDRNEISTAEYEVTSARWSRESRGRGGSGGNYYYTKLAYLGRPYVNLALQAFRRDRITEKELAQYLDVKQKSIPGIENYFLSSSAA